LWFIILTRETIDLVREILCSKLLGRPKKYDDLKSIFGKEAVGL